MTSLFSPVLSTRSHTRQRVYHVLLADPAAWWTVREMARQLSGLSEESIRATLYLLESDRLVTRVSGQRWLTFQLTEHGKHALNSLLRTWQAAAGLRPAPAGGMPTHDRRPAGDAL